MRLKISTEYLCAVRAVQHLSFLRILLSFCISFPSPLFIYTYTFIYLFCVRLPSGDGSLCASFCSSFCCVGTRTPLYIFFGWHFSFLFLLFFLYPPPPPDSCWMPKRKSKFNVTKCVKGKLCASKYYHARTHSSTYYYKIHRKPKRKLSPERERHFFFAFSFRSSLSIRNAYVYILTKS